MYFYLLENIVSGEYIFKSLRVLLNVGASVVTEQERKIKHDDFLRVKINLPSFELELETKDASKTLFELRRILEVLQVDDQIVYEECVVQELTSLLSESFIGNTQVMDWIKKLLKQENDYRVATTNIPLTAEFDFDQQTKELHLSKNMVQKNIEELVKTIDTKSVKHGIVSVSGPLKNEEKLLIVDHIHQRMPTAQMRAFQSERSGESVLVECIFFGEFTEYCDDE